MIDCTDNCQSNSNSNNNHEWEPLSGWFDSIYTHDHDSDNKSNDNSGDNSNNSNSKPQVDCLQPKCCSNHRLVKSQRIYFQCCQCQTFFQNRMDCFVCNQNNPKCVNYIICSRCYYNQETILNSSLFYSMMLQFVENIKLNHVSSKLLTSVFEKYLKPCKILNEIQMYYAICGNNIDNKQTQRFSFESNYLNLKLNYHDLLLAKGDLIDIFQCDIFVKDCRNNNDNSNNNNNNNNIPMIRCRAFATYCIIDIIDENKIKVEWIDQDGNHQYNDNDQDICSESIVDIRNVLIAKAGSIATSLNDRFSTRQIEIGSFVEIRKYNSRLRKEKEYFHTTWQLGQVIGYINPIDKYSNKDIGHSNSKRIDGQCLIKIDHKCHHNQKLAQTRRYKMDNGAILSNRQAFQATEIVTVCINDENLVRMPTVQPL